MFRRRARDRVIAIGPPLIGQLASTTGLRTALAVIPTQVLLIAVAITRIPSIRSTSGESPKAHSLTSRRRPSGRATRAVGDTRRMPAQVKDPDVVKSHQHGSAHG
jgi:hypothetical protein